MKTLKKVAAVLAASMALNAVAFTGAFSASAAKYSLCKTFPARSAF